MNTSKTIADLLNDESFLRWIRDEATIPEKKKWTQWLSENPNYQVKVEKAQKIVFMPFKNPDKLSGKAEEIRKMKESLFKKKKLEAVKSEV